MPKPPVTAKFHFHTVTSRLFRILHVVNSGNYSLSGPAEYAKIEKNRILVFCLYNVVF